MKSLINCLLTALLILSLSSCTKDTTADKLLHSPLLNRLPDNTIGFAISNRTNPAAKKFLATAWAKSGSSSGLIESIVGSNPEYTGALKYSKSLNQHLLKIEEYLICLTQSSSEIPAAFAALAKMSSSSDAKALIELQSKLEDSTYTITKIKTGDAEGLKIQTAGSSTVLYAVADNNLVVVSTSEQLIGSLLNPTPAASYFEQLKNTEQFKNSASKVEVTDDAITFGFADGQKVIELVQSLPDVPASSTNLSALKGSSLAYRRSFDSGLNDKVVLTSSSPFKDAAGRNFVDLGSSQPLLSEAANSSIAYISIAGALLKTLTEEISKVSQSEPLPLNLDSLKSVGLGVAPGSGQSIFPDLYSVIKSDDPQVLADTLKGAISGAVQQQALPTSQWTTKEIQGIKTEYMISLIGVGLFIAPAEEHLLIGSSEQAVTAAILASSGSGKALADQLSGPAMSIAQTPNGLAAGFLDFNSLYESIKSLQGSMAMFSGGTPPSLEKLEELKSYGTLTFNASIKESDIEFSSRVDLPPSD